MRLVLADRPADPVAEIVEAVDRGLARPVEPVARIEGVVLHEFEQRAMELVGSPLGDEQQLRTRIPSIFGAEIVRN